MRAWRSYAVTERISLEEHLTANGFTPRGVVNRRYVHDSLNNNEIVGYLDNPFAPEHLIVKPGSRLDEFAQEYSRIF
jgi:hypothetical protein